MWKRYGSWIVFGAMLLGGSVVLLGEMDDSVSLFAAMEVWGDVIRDVDQLGLKLTRVSDQKEMEIGRDLAKGLFTESARSRELQPYVESVGKSLVPHVRRSGIHYEFHVIETSWINAFAMPGGQIFITTGMLAFLKSEAELAGILGHEISHVDQRHCIEQLQTQIAMERIGVDEIGRLAELPRLFLAAGYKKYQELEADATGLRLAVVAGYDPESIVLPFERLLKEFNETERRPARQLVSEVVSSLEQAIDSYFDSHPPTAERIARLKQLISQQRKWRESKKFRTGVEDYIRQFPNSQELMSNPEDQKRNEIRAESKELSPQ
jgi:predicted Zn-dependent protease